MVGGQLLRHLDQRRNPRRVVVGAMVDLAFFIGARERTGRLAGPEMIDMRANDQRRQPALVLAVKVEARYHITPGALLEIECDVGADGDADEIAPGGLA